MAATLTLKNIPRGVYDRLKASATVHHRSLNKEAIYLLETSLAPARRSVEEVLERARALRESSTAKIANWEKVDSYKREGRP